LQPRFRFGSGSTSATLLGVHLALNSNMAPSTQKALLLDAKFGKFVVDTIPVPKPDPGDILVKVKAAALNPVDWKIHKNGLFVEMFKFPAILGVGISGDVELLGEGVTDFKKGDRV